MADVVVPQFLAPCLITSFDWRIYFQPFFWLFDSAFQLFHRPKTPYRQNEQDGSLYTNQSRAIEAIQSSSRHYTISTYLWIHARKQKVIETHITSASTLSLSGCLTARRGKQVPTGPRTKPNNHESTSYFPSGTNGY